MSNVSPLADEPFRPPYVDLASRVEFIPGALMLETTTTEVGRSWETLFRLYERQSYRPSRRKSRAVERFARELVGDATEARPRAERIYRFVRDEISTRPSAYLLTAEEPLDAAFGKRHASHAEKALILQLMLEAVEVESHIAWSNLRRWGELHREMPNISRVNHMLVAVKLDDGLHFLDPDDANAALGRLRPDLEGMNVLILTKKPYWEELPETPARSSKRLALITLSVDEQGRLAGTGDLRLTGHHAWRSLNRGDTPEATKEAWREWIEKRFAGHDITDVEVSEQLEERKIRVGWSMAQRDEEVLGDEVVVPIAAPLAIETNPFSLPAEARTTDVRLPFEDANEVRLSVTWPEGWEVDIEPDTSDVKNPERRGTPRDPAGPRQAVADRQPSRRLVPARRSGQERLQRATERDSGLRRGR